MKTSKKVLLVCYVFLMAACIVFAYLCLKHDVIEGAIGWSISLVVVLINFIIDLPKNK